MKKPTLTTVSSGFNSTTTLNNNFTALRDAFDNTLSLDGSTPNAMNADLDMNSKDLLNVGDLDTESLRINGVLVAPSSVVTAPNATAVTYNQGGTGAVNRTVANKLRESVSVKDFGAVGDGVTDDTAAIQAAVAATNTSGQWLIWNKGTYRVTSALSFTLSKMQWASEGAVILIDTSGDIPQGVGVTLSDSADHSIVGSGFEVNANGRCNGAIQFLQPLGTQTASIYLEKVGARNVEMYAAAAVGSFGVSVRGGFKQVKLIDPYAENIMMRTGAGVIGSRGVTGIAVRNNFGTTGAYPAKITIERPTVRRVYSQDAAYQYDMDGIGIFANPTDYTFGPAYAEVLSPDISGCWGRDIKTQISGCRVADPLSLRDEGPTGGIIHPTIDFQAGPGVGSGGQFTVDGVSVLHCVGFQMASTTPCASRWDGGSVAVYNGGALSAFALGDSIGGVLTKFVATVTNVDVNGPITNFAQVRTNGFDAHTIKLDGIVCSSISESLVRAYAGPGGSAPYRVGVYTKNCVNLGSMVPTVTCNIAGISADALLDDYGGIGFGPASVSLTGTGPSFSGLSMRDSAQLPIPLNQSVNSGTQKFYSFALDAGAEITLPGHGFNANYFAEIIIGTNRNGYAYLTVDSSAINTINAGSAASIGTTSDPGTGDLRVWRSTGTNQLVVKNGTAAARIFLVRFLG